MSNSLGAILSPYASHVAASSTRPRPLDNTTPTTGSTNTSSNAGEAGMSANDLGTTFLQLLGQELQNQDPTQPMDPTQEVGQLISLNQLNQLISINDVITGTGTTSSSSSTQPVSGNSSQNPSVKPDASQNDAALAAQALAAAGANSSTQPLDLGTLLSLYGGK